MLSSRPAISLIVLLPELRKSSYPSPPDITNKVRFVLVLTISVLLSLSLGKSSVLPQTGDSTKVKNRTWPVCPWGMPVRNVSRLVLAFNRNYDLILPVTTGGVDPLVIFDPAIVSSTPALVPTHIRSLQASSDVTRRQAALCCLIMSSQFDSILFTDGARLTSKMTS